VWAELSERQEAGEKNFIHTATETFFSVDLDDGNALVIALAERGIGVDIHQLRGLAMPAKNSQGIVAKVAVPSRVEDDLGHGASTKNVS
jgi:hypothetical protein